jgi:hypothetical protein
MPYSALFGFSRVKSIWVKAALCRGEEYYGFQTKPSPAHFRKLNS